MVGASITVGVGGFAVDISVEEIVANVVDVGVTAIDELIVMVG